MKTLNLINNNSQNNFWQRSWQKLHLDGHLTAGILLLSVAGLLILFSASNSNFSIMLHQAILLVIGFAFMFVTAQIPPRTYKIIAPWLFAITIVMLLAVLGIGAISKGAQRWLGFGAFRFQPSEIMKLGLPMMLAWYLNNKVLPPKAKELLMATIILVVPVLLVAKQPDLGTAIAIGAVGVIVLFFAGISWKIISSIIAFMLISTPITWHFLHDYQKSRILTFLHPESDPLGDGYHIIQSKIAIGSGGFWGKGWLHGTQSHLQFLPEHATDFIFGVVGEELGLLGAIALISISLYIVGRGLYISYQAQDTFSRLLAGALSMAFFISLFINIGMTIGILPVVGMPLPLVSYGGSSIVTLMLGFGILMSIQTHKKLISM